MVPTPGTCYKEDGSRRGEGGEVTASRSRLRDERYPSGPLQGSGTIKDYPAGKGHHTRAGVPVPSRVPVRPGVFPAHLPGCLCILELSQISIEMALTRTQVRVGVM